MHEHNFAALLDDLIFEVALAACQLSFDQEVTQNQKDKMDKIKHDLVTAFKEAKGEQMDMTEGT